MKNLCFAGTAIVMLSVGQLNAAILTFDDLTPTGSFASIPNGYGGLNWNTMSYLNAPSHSPNSGYNNNRVSGDYVAFNLNALTATVSNGQFTFNGAWFGAAWNDNLRLTIKGFNNGMETHSHNSTVQYTAPTWIGLNWAVDELRISSAGGVDHGGDNGSGTHFTMDNFTYNHEVVPEPSSLALLGIGVVGVGLLRRRKK